MFLICSLQLLEEEMDEEGGRGGAGGGREREREINPASSQAFPTIPVDLRQRGPVDPPGESAGGTQREPRGELRPATDTQNQSQNWMED